MHKAFTRHCLSDAIKNLGVEVKTYARTARDNAYIVARGFAPRTFSSNKQLIMQWLFVFVQETIAALHQRSAFCLTSRPSRYPPGLYFAAINPADAYGP